EPARRAEGQRQRRDGQPPQPVVDRKPRIVVDDDAATAVDAAQRAGMPFALRAPARAYRQLARDAAQQVVPAQLRGRLLERTLPAKGRLTSAHARRAPAAGAAAPWRSPARTRPVRARPRRSRSAPAAPARR